MGNESSRARRRRPPSWDEMQVAGTNVGVRRTSVSSEIDEKRNLRPIREALAWILLVTILWGTDLVAKILAAEQSGVPADYFRVVSEQVTSAIAALVMVLFLVQWVKLLPRTLDAWPRIVIGHFIGSVFFAFGHFALMVALRIPWYAINGKSYVWREPFVANLIVEYQKDIKIYIGFVVLISAYQYYRRSRDADPQPHAAGSSCSRARARTCFDSKTSTTSKRPETMSPCMRATASMSCATRWPASQTSLRQARSSGRTEALLSMSTRSARSATSTRANASSSQAVRKCPLAAATVKRSRSA